MATSEIRVTVDDEKVREAVRRTLREMAEEGDLAARLAEAEAKIDRVWELVESLQSGGAVGRALAEQVIRALDGPR